MRLLIFLSFWMILMYSESCKSDNIKAGAKGNIQVGEGSCAPPIDYTSRYYYDFTGTIYFVEKASLDSIAGGSFSALLKSSDSTTVENGSFSAALEPGTFYVLLQDRSYTGSNNVITIYYERVTEQDFQYWKCTSY